MRGWQESEKEVGEGRTRMMTCLRRPRHGPRRQLVEPLETTAQPAAAAASGAHLPRALVVTEECEPWGSRVRGGAELGEEAVAFWARGLFCAEHNSVRGRGWEESGGE